MLKLRPLKSCNVFFNVFASQPYVQIKCDIYLQLATFKKYSRTLQLLFINVKVKQL